MKTIHTVSEIKNNLSIKKYRELDNLAKCILQDDLNPTWKSTIAIIEAKNYESDKLCQNLLASHIVFPSEEELINTLIESGLTRKELTNLNYPKNFLKLKEIANFKYNLENEAILINRINELLVIKGMLFLTNKEKVEILATKTRIADILSKYEGIISLEYGIDLFTNPITVNINITYDSGIIKNINEIVISLSKILALSNNITLNLDISPLQKEVYVLEDNHIVRKLINQN